MQDGPQGSRAGARWLRRAGWAGLALLAAAALAAWRLPEAAAWWWRVHAGAPEMSGGPFTLAEGLRWFDDYYVVADLGHGAYAIGEPRYGQCNFSYLIVGARRALLFDSGPGIRDIRPVVKSLTGLPVLALPSHLHFDHVGNLGRVPAVALPDLPGLRAQVRDGRFRLGFYQYLGFVEGLQAPQFAVSEWLRPGAAIDLGGIVLTLVSTPGHTPDSVVLHDPAANRLFAGDFIYPSSIFAYLPGADLADYAASARHVGQLLDAGSRVYGAHGCDVPPRVEVPVLDRADVGALGRALEAAAGSPLPDGLSFPRQLPVNSRMKLLAKYPWMSR